MINTNCPECSARFFVSEELVGNRVVRFRCRKCHGTITVDGTRIGKDSTAATSKDRASSGERTPSPPTAATTLSMSSMLRPSYIPDAGQKDGAKQSTPIHGKLEHKSKGRYAVVNPDRLSGSASRPKKDPVDEPTTMESPIAGLSTSEPSITDLPLPELPMAEPSIAELTLVEPSMADLPIAEPSIAELTIVEPTMVEPMIAETSFAEPSLAELTIAEPPQAELPEAGLVPEPVPHRKTNELVSRATKSEADEFADPAAPVEPSESAEPVEAAAQEAETDKVERGPKQGSEQIKIGEEADGREISSNAGVVSADHGVDTKAAAPEKAVADKRRADKRHADKQKAAPSKARQSRVSMSLGSVFEMPSGDEDFDIPVDVDDATALDDDVELDPLPIAAGRSRAGAFDGPSDRAPKKKPPPAPVLAPSPGRFKPPPPKQRSAGADDSDRIDLGFAFQPSSRISEPPTGLLDFGASAISPLEAPKGFSDATAADAPLLSPALAIAGRFPAAMDEPEQEQKPTSSSLPIYIGIGAAVLAVVLCVGYLALRAGDSEQPTAQTREGSMVAAAVPEETEAPAFPTPRPEPEPQVVPPTDTSEALAATEPDRPSQDPQPSQPHDSSASAHATPAGTAVADGHAAGASTTGAAATTATAVATTAAAATAAAATATTAAAATTAPETAAAATTPLAAAPSPTPAANTGPEFDAAAARSSIQGLTSAIQSCKQPDGPTGTASVAVTWAPSGRVQNARINTPLFQHPVGGCIVAKLRNATVPPFGGSAKTTTITVRIN